jgi:hypothetical protein
MHAGGAGAVSSRREELSGRDGGSGLRCDTAHARRRCPSPATAQRDWLVGGCWCRFPPVMPPLSLSLSLLHVCSCATENPSSGGEELSGRDGGSGLRCDTAHGRRRCSSPATAQRGRLAGGCWCRFPSVMPPLSLSLLHVCSCAIENPSSDGALLPRGADNSSGGCVEDDLNFQLPSLLPSLSTAACWGISTGREGPIAPVPEAVLPFWD